MDKMAWESDGVILINRIKPHTNFWGSIGSGLQKMLSIGLGKMKGASAYHKIGRVRGLEKIICEAAACLLQSGKVLGGLAILENSAHETAKIEWIPCAAIPIREPELFTLACQWYGRLPFDRLHGLIVDEAGKEISGTGMDTNVIGRRMMGGLVEAIENGPRIDAIYLRGLSEKSGGNCCGAGLADLGHRQLSRQSDPIVSRINALTALDAAIVRMPILFDNDQEALAHMPYIMTCIQPSLQKTLWIKNTQRLSPMWVSEALWDECQNRKDLDIQDTPSYFNFDEQGNISTDYR
jgi:hypothetical protein